MTYTFYGDDGSRHHVKVAWKKGENGLELFFLHPDGSIYDKISANFPHIRIETPDEVLLDEARYPFALDVFFSRCKFARKSGWSVKKGFQQFSAWKFDLDQIEQI